MDVSLPKGSSLSHFQPTGPLARQGRFRHPSTRLSRQPAVQESKWARPPPPHGCLGTALGSASQRAWQHTGPAGPAASPRGSTLCVAATTSEGFKVAGPQLRDSKGLQVWVSDGKDSPRGSGQTWALTPGQSEEVTEIVSGECVQWGCWRGSVGRGRPSKAARKTGAGQTSSPAYDAVFWFLKSPHPPNNQKVLHRGRQLRTSHPNPHLSLSEKTHHPILF